MTQIGPDVRVGQATRGSKRPLLLVLALGVAVSAVSVFFYVQPHAIEFQEQHYDASGTKIDRPTVGDSIEITEFRGPRKTRGTTVSSGRYVLRGKHTPLAHGELTIGFTGGRTIFKSYRRTNKNDAQSGSRVSFEIEFYVDGFQPLPITPQAQEIQWKRTGQAFTELIRADLSTFDGQAGLLAVIMPPDPDPYLGRKGDRVVLVPQPPGDHQ
jgi:hypothetical protein